MSLIKNFFKQTRILDGGMGQELLNRGVIPHGTIWGATALLHKKYHKLLVKTHLDFIKAGAEVIVTNSFGSRKRRLIENKLGDKFNELNNLTPDKLRITNIIKVISEYNRKIFKDCFNVSALLKDRKLVNVFLKL